MKYAMSEPWMNWSTFGLDLSQVLKPEHKTEKLLHGCDYIHFKRSQHDLDQFQTLMGLRYRWIGFNEILLSEEDLTTIWLFCVLYTVLYSTHTLHRIVTWQQNLDSANTESPFELFCSGVFSGQEAAVWLYWVLSQLFCYFLNLNLGP